MQKDKTPRLIITGDRDRLVGAATVDEQLGKFDPPAEYHVVAGADHFWVGRESEMAETVVQFFLRHLAAP